jgi:hypothetical protein
VTLESSEANGIVQLRRETSGYDGFNRPTQVRETVQSGSTSLLYTLASAFDDVAHVAYSRDNYTTQINALNEKRFLLPSGEWKRWPEMSEPEECAIVIVHTKGDTTDGRKDGRVD